MKNILATRYHDCSIGHRVHNHESKCAYMHGHNYRIHFSVGASLGLPPLDGVGRVLDFSVINTRLCMWVEENWDHKFLAWTGDPVMQEIYNKCHPITKGGKMLEASIVWVGFNPTAENMGEYLLRQVGPSALLGTGCVLREVVIEETRKCSVICKLENKDEY